MVPTSLGMRGSMKSCVPKEKVHDVSPLQDSVADKFGAECRNVIADAVRLAMRIERPGDPGSIGRTATLRRMRRRAGWSKSNVGGPRPCQSHPSEPS